MVSTNILKDSTDLININEKCHLLLTLRITLKHMSWAKEHLILNDGSRVEAMAPVIISASRSTDIPAFYSDWFFHRLRCGYSVWTNPFNGVKSYISYKNTRFIVFWSKNPRPIIPYLEELKKDGIGCYIQFTLNDYVEEGLEKSVPSVESRIETFKELVKILGVGRVIWRFDPLVLTDTITIDVLLAKIERIADQLKGYCEKLVFSFVDISLYKKVETNLKRNNIHYLEWTQDLMEEFASRLSELNKRWGYELATCGERIDIEKYGIKHNKCVDDELMIRFASEDAVLMKHLGVEVHETDLFGDMPEGSIPVGDGRYAVRKKNIKDKGQRAFCGCIASKDIGEYNTCPHQCEYCYANSSKEVATNNYKRHLASPLSETITGI